MSPKGENLSCGAAPAADDPSRDGGNTRTGCDMATLIPLVLKGSILLTVFVIGLSTEPQDLIYVARRPGLLVRSLLSINFVMPLFVTSLVAATHLLPVIAIILIALSVSPVPPLLPRKARKATGDSSYAIGLLVVVALLAVAFVPLAVDLIGRAFDAATAISPTAIASLLARDVLAPLGVGLLVHYSAPPFAERIARPLSIMAWILLCASLLPIFFIALPAILSLIGNGTLVAIMAFVGAGLAAGHLLGGPDPANRTILALTTSSRHPGVAMAIVSFNFPQQKLAAPAILLYLLVNILLSVVYIAWMRHRAPRLTDTHA
jgi:bile acid:Na+ symporter, BASS family